MVAQTNRFVGKKPGTRLRAKYIWHPYNLQMLSPDKFIEVVERIRKNEYSLLARPAVDTNTKSPNSHIGSTFPVKLPRLAHR